MCGVTHNDKIRNEHIRGTTGFQKDDGETIELVRICEERRRTHTEESAEDGYASEKEERTTENKKDACQRDLKCAGLEQARRRTGRHGVEISSRVTGKAREKKKT